MTAWFNQDGWRNVLTGMGSEYYDRSLFTDMLARLNLTDQQLESAGRDDDLCRKIVGKLPSECFRKGFKLQGEDRVVKHCEDRWSELDCTAVLLEAIKDGRLYGGSVLVMFDESDMSQPKVGRGTPITHLVDVDRRYAQCSIIDQNPSNPRYGKSDSYQLNTGAGSCVVHHSKAIRFGGIGAGLVERIMLQGWDYSVLQPVWDVVAKFALGYNSVMHMLSQASQAVMGIKGFYDMLSSNNTRALEDRMRAANLSRGIMRAMMVDTEETFEVQELSFNGISGIIDAMMHRVASAAEMPVTLLFGRAPAGMNATGESDIQLWYDGVATEQKNRYQPVVATILDRLAGEIGQQAPAIEWRSLWEQTAAEKATTDKTQADADHVRIADGVLLPDEVALSRYNDKSDVKINRELREIALATVGDTPTPAPLTPTQYATAYTVNEIRKGSGHPPLPAEIGNLTVYEWTMKLEAMYGVAPPQG